MSDLQFPHRRFNPLRRQWVLVSPHRTARPWQGEVIPPQDSPTSTTTPPATSAPATPAPAATSRRIRQRLRLRQRLRRTPPRLARPTRRNAPDLLRADRERGRCRVLCFHPDHSLTLARMSVPDIRRVVDAWTDEYRTLGADPIPPLCPDLREPRRHDGRQQSPSPRPDLDHRAHPRRASAETDSLRDYRASHGTCLLCDYATRSKPRSKSASSPRTTASSPSSPMGHLAL